MLTAFWSRSFFFSSCLNNRISWNVHVWLQRISWFDWYLNMLYFVLNLEQNVHAQRAFFFIRSVFSQLKCRFFVIWMSLFSADVHHNPIVFDTKERGAVCVCEREMLRINSGIYQKIKWLCGVFVCTRILSNVEKYARTIWHVTRLTCIIRCDSQNNDTNHNFIQFDKPIRHCSTLLQSLSFPGINECTFALTMCTCVFFRPFRPLFDDAMTQ